MTTEVWRAGRFRAVGHGLRRGYAILIAIEDARSKTPVANDLRRFTAILEVPSQLRVNFDGWAKPDSSEHCMSGRCPEV